MGNLTLFPDPEDVFLDEVSVHSRYLFPWGLYEFSSGHHKGLSIPLVVPYEPPDGFVGWKADTFHTYWCRENWLGFDLVNGKIRLQTEFDYFAINNSYKSWSADDLERCYKKRRRDYLESKERFKKLGYVANGYGENLVRDDRQIVNLSDDGWAELFQVGGIDVAEDTIDYISVGKPLNPAGIPVDLIGIFGSSIPLIGCACDTCVFIDSDSSTLALTFSYS